MYAHTHIHIDITCSSNVAPIYFHVEHDYLHLFTCSTCVYVSIDLYTERGQHEKKQMKDGWIHTQMTMLRWVKSLGTPIIQPFARSYSW